MINKNNDIILELKPKPRHEGYARLQVTIDGKSFLPKKKEYYALSGTMLKVCDLTSFEFGSNGKVVGVCPKFL